MKKPGGRPGSFGIQQRDQAGFARAANITSFCFLVASISTSL
jgi:hypothetical protein